MKTDYKITKNLLFRQSQKMRRAEGRVKKQVRHYNKYLKSQSRKRSWNSCHKSFDAMSESSLLSPIFRNMCSKSFCPSIFSFR